MKVCIQVLFKYLGCHPRKGRLGLQKKNLKTHKRKTKFCCSSEKSTKQPQTRTFTETMLKTEKSREKSKCASIGKQKMSYNKIIQWNTILL